MRQQIIFSVFIILISLSTYAQKKYELHLGPNIPLSGFADKTDDNIFYGGSGLIGIRFRGVRACGASYSP